MKNLVTGSALAVLLLTQVGCGSGFEVKDLKGEKSAEQSSVVKKSVATAQANVYALDEGVQLNESAFDASDLTDDEIIAAVIEDLEESLKNVDAQIKKLKDSGTTTDAELAKMFEQLKVATNDLINRLKTDTEFRKSLVEAIRNPPTPPSTADFAEACKQMGEDLKNGKIPEQVKSGAQAFYDQNCKE